MFSVDKSPNSSGVERFLGKEKVSGSNPDLGSSFMLGMADTRMTMVYWKSENFWLGKLLEHPEIMTQGESLEELEENIRDAYLMMAMDEVPGDYHVKEIRI